MSDIVDKNQSTIDFLLECPIIQDNPLFFNFTDNEEGDANQIVTMYDDKALQKPYVDGSVLKRYTFNLICYKPISYNQVVKMPGYSDENVQNMAIVQSVIDWITEQSEKRVFPNFGESCIIEDMESLTADPSIDAINTKADPPLAAYTVGVVITYIDISKAVWNN